MNKNRLIKKNLYKLNEFYDSKKINDEYIEIFKNPTLKELQYILKDNEYESIRGIISNNVSYAWNGKFLHNYLSPMLDVSNSIHFTYLSGYSIDMNMENKFNLEQTKEILKTNIDLLKNLEKLYPYFVFFGIKDCIIHYNDIPLKDFLNDIN